MAENVNSLSQQSAALIKDEQFQAMPAQDRLKVFSAFASKADPEGFAKLNPVEQAGTAAKIINEHNPGFMDSLKSVATAAGKMVPVIGPAASAAANPEQERPFTRGILRSIGLTANQLMDTSAPGGPTTADAGDAGKRFEQAVSATATGRFVAEATRDVAELVGGFKIASAAVKGVMGRFGMDKAGELMARALGAGSADEAATLATQAARRKLVENVTSRLATDVTAGELFGASNAIERGEVKPLEDLVMNPVMMAALGLGLMGGAAGLKKFGPVRVQEATAALEGQGPAGADLKGVSRDAQQFANAFRRASGLDKEAAGEAVYKIATGTADASENKLARDLLLSDPTLVKNEFGLHLTRMLRPLLETRVEVADGPLRVRYEDPKTRRETTVSVSDPAEARALAKQAEQGAIHVIEAKGPARAIAPFEPAPASKPSVVDGTEIMGDRHSEASSSVETRSTSPQVADAERHTAAASSARGVPTADVSVQGEWNPQQRMGFEGNSNVAEGPQLELRASPPSMVDAMEREQTRSPLDAAPQVSPQPLVLDSPPPVGVTRLAPGPGPTRVQTLTPRWSKTGAQELAPDYAGTPPAKKPMTTNERLGIVLSEPTPRPEPNTLVAVKGSTQQASVVSTMDPRGVTSRLPTGDVIISKYGPDGVTMPDWMTAPPEASSVSAPRAVLEAQKAAREGVGETSMTFTDPQGRTQVTTPNPTLRTVTVVDPVTRHAEVTTPDVVSKAIGEGGLKVDADLTGMNVGQLLARAEELSASNGPRSLSDVTTRIAEHGRVVRELMTRSGVTLDPIVNEGSIAKRLAKPFASEEGAITIGPGGRYVETNVLRRDDPVSIQARAVGGRARGGENGSVIVDFTLGKQRLSVTYASKAEADAGLRSVVISRLEQARITEGMSRAVKGKLGDAVSIDAELLDPLSRVRNAWEMAPVGDANRYTTGWFTKPFEALMAPVARINRFGQAGQEFVQRLTAAKNSYDMRRGRLMIQLEKELGDLPAAEVEKLVTAYESGTASPQAMAAMERLSGATRQQLVSGKQAGLDVAELVEGRYAPHNFDVAQMRDKRATTALIDEVKAKGFARSDEEALAYLGERGLGTSRAMVASNLVADAKKRGYEMTRTEAESVMDRYITDNAQRISGNMERGRIGVQGYIEDARRSYAITFSRNARRLSEAEFFGPSDEHMNRLIDEIRDTEGLKAADYAKKVFDAVVGRDRVQLDGIGSALYNWQTAKLSLSLMANSLQPQNTGVRTGWANMVRGLFEAGASAVKEPINTLKRQNAATMHAREVGAITSDILGDIRSQGLPSIDQSMAARVISKSAGTVQDTLTALFQVVEETSNRAAAVPAGERYFTQQVERLRANPGDVTARRRIQELGFKADSVLAMGEADLTTVKYLAGQRLSNETQFKSDAMHTPLWANSTPGKFLFQFKSFALNQAGMMANEIFGGHGDPVRRVRALSALLITYPVTGAALAKLRSSLTGETPASKVIDEAISDPSVQNVIIAGLAGMAVSGALGIIGDTAMTFATMSPFSARATFAPPTLDTLINTVDIGSSVVQGMVGGDEMKYQHAARTAAREFGGLGTAAANAVLGEAPKGGGGGKSFGGSGFSGRSFSR